MTAEHSSAASTLFKTFSEFPAVTLFTILVAGLPPRLSGGFTRRLYGGVSDLTLTCSCFLCRFPFIPQVSPIDNMKQEELVQSVKIARPHKNRGKVRT